MSSFSDNNTIHEIWELRNVEERILWNYSYVLR